MRDSNPAHRKNEPIRPQKSRLKPDLDALEDRRLLSADFKAFGTEESLVTGVAATLDVANYVTKPSGHIDAATIDWGDGSATTAGTIDPLGDISFLGSAGSITGAHTYAKSGSYTVTTTLVEHNASGDVTVNVTGTLMAVPASVTATPAPTILAAQGQALSGQVLATVQTNVPGAATSFKVTIDWGDGSTPTTGTLQSLSPPAPGGDGDGPLVSSLIQGVDDFLGTPHGDHGSAVYSVVGDHTYATAGSYTAKITIDDGLGDTTEADTPVTVAAGTLTVQSPASLDDISGFALSGPVARVVDLATGAKSDPSQLTATIDWGDGSTPTTGEVHALPDFLANSGDHPTYSVSGNHTYASAGNETVTITVTDKSGRTAVTTTTVNVKAEALNLTPTAVSATSGIGGLFQVASGTDAPLVRGNHLTATIDWGDGSTPTTGHVLPVGWGLQPPGSISAGTLSFTVVGEHIYSSAGTYTVHVTVTSDAGATATTDATATVTSFFARGIPGTAVAGTAITNQPVAVIGTSGNSSAAAGDFTASIDWGDGSPVDTGTVVAKDAPAGPISDDLVSSRTFYVAEGTHTFAAAGTFHAKVTITDTKTGESTTVTSDFVVSAAALPVGSGTPPGGSTTSGGTTLPITVTPLPTSGAPPGGTVTVVPLPISGTIGGSSGQGPVTSTVPITVTTPTATTTHHKVSKPSSHHPKVLVKIRSRHPHGPLG